MKLYVYNLEKDWILEFIKGTKLDKKNILILDTLEKNIEYQTLVEIAELLGYKEGIKLKAPLFTALEFMEYRNKNKKIKDKNKEVLKLSDNIYIWEDEKLTKITSIFDRGELGLWKIKDLNCILSILGEADEPKCKKN